ncbi:MAG: serine hydrolase [Candidatus Micrarchaeaceae archaeon]
MFPGCVLAIGFSNSLATYPFGKLTYDNNSQNVTSKTIYDVASLTKPIVTTTSIMILLQKKKISLNDPIYKYIPEWLIKNNYKWRKRITVKMLLLHSSGLASHLHHYRLIKDREKFLDIVIHNHLSHEPDRSIEYSDLNFILLGEIIERITNQSLYTFAKKNIFLPLGMRSTMFNPPRNLIKNIAPTEIDNTYRKRLIHGEVHDIKAWAMGGISGHAGLFSTADDISKFAQMLLNEGTYKGHRVLDKKIIKKFIKRYTINNSSRALGWDVPTKNSSSGNYFSKSSYGHTGFTGTSLWIDPKRKLFVVFLTNRIYPTRLNEKIKQVRPKLHDLVIEELD